jgi:hypothetical protein
MELEVKGFIEFCRFLSQHPDKIISNEELAKMLDFCLNSLSSCNCQSQDNEKKKISEGAFIEKIKMLSQKSLDDLALIIDNSNQFSIIYISSAISEDKIKVK